MADRRGDARAELELVITRQQPFGPPDAAQFTWSTELLRMLYDPSNRIHQQAESSGAPYVIGRKGSGKTAFVTAPKLAERAVAVELPSADVYQGVFDVVAVMVDRGLRLLPEHTARLWRHLAWTAVLAQLIRGSRQRSSSHRLVREFVGSLGEGAVPGDAHAAVSAYLRRLRRLVDADEPVGGLGELLNSVAGNGHTITDAIAAGERILGASPQRYVLVVDSLEHYIGVLPTDDYHHAERVAFEGLFRFIGGDGTLPGRRFDIRFAFPAEMWNVLETVSANPIKDFHRRVLAHWSARELLTLIGNRINVYLHLYEPHLVSAPGGEPVAHPAPVGYEQARRLIARVLPDQVTNGYGGTEDTVAYLLRHTQLLPRHLITTLNRVWEAHFGRDAGAALPVAPLAVIEGVRAGEAEIVRDVLASYGVVHPTARLCCERTVPELGNVVDGGELHRVYNRAGVRKETGLEYRQYVRTLIEIGCLGRVVGVRSTARYVVGEFEYTRSGSMQVGSDDRLCLHPLFAEAFDGRDAAGRGPSLRAEHRRSLVAVYPVGSDPTDPTDYRDAL